MSSDNNGFKVDLSSFDLDELLSSLQSARESLVPDSAKEKKTEEEKEAVGSIVKLLGGSAEEERERLWAILDLIPAYVVLLDSAHNVRLSNKSFKDYFGKDQGLCHKILRQDSKPCLPCNPLDSLKTNSRCVMEWITPDRKHAFRTYCYPFEDKSGEKLLLKVGFSVSANMRIKQALHLSESSYRVITDNLSIGVAVLGLNLSVVAGNTRLNQWVEGESLKGKRLCDLLQCNGDQPFPEQGSFCPDCPFGLALKDKLTHEKEFIFKIKGQAKNQKKDQAREQGRVMRLVACPVVPGKGVVRALVLMLEDITKRIALNKHLQRARQLEVAGTLAGGIAHEINQPLSALSLYASGLQMLLEKSDPVDSETLMERLGFILNESEKIRSIISNMRALVMRSGMRDLEDISVEEVAKRAVFTAKKRLADHGIKVEIDFPQALPKVKSQTVQLEQVVINLLSNAIHAIDSLPPSEDASSKPLRLIRVGAKLNKSGNRLVLYIEDSGVGLPPEQEKVFDPFFTTKDNAGMGLGLSIVHGLVNSWGGELSVRPRGGKLGGATFYVALPLAEA